MKKLLYTVSAVLFALAGCKKNEIKVDPLASLSVVNTVMDGKVVRLNTNLRDSCLNMAYTHFTIIAGSSSPIKAFPSGSPNTPYFNQNPDTHAGDIYSLFLTGTHTAPESVLIKENIPPYPTTDVVNVRLINLSPGSGALSMNLSTSPGTNIFNTINYKQASDFVTMPLPVSAPEVARVFEVRKADGSLLTSYTLATGGTVSVPSSRHRNITLIVKGISGGTAGNAVGVIALPHY